MPWRTLQLIFRVGLGVAILVAVGRQLSIHIALGFPLLNYFSYFTTLANLIAAGVLLSGARRQLRRDPPSAPSDRARHLSVIYMTVVGVVYVTLLRHIDLGALRPWINTLLHYVVPVAVMAEWLLDPPLHRLTFRDVLIGQVFPWAYLGYSLARGAIVGWYPYPFLNPAAAGGYGAVATTVLGIVALFTVTGVVLMSVGGRPARA